MAPASSPYAVFRASEWNSVETEPSGFIKSLRIESKKHYKKRITQKEAKGASMKVLSRDHVQLAFA